MSFLTIRRAWLAEMERSGFVASMYIYIGTQSSSWGSSMAVQSLATHWLVLVVGNIIEDPRQDVLGRHWYNLLGYENHDSFL
jgi:hypothetical protein